MVELVRNEAHRAFLELPESELGTRVKDVRANATKPGGRTEVRLFESVEGGRPHPRLHMQLPPAEDPSPFRESFAPAEIPRSAKALEAAIEAALKQHERRLTAADLDVSQAPAGSENYWRNSIRGQRIAAFFQTVRRQVGTWLGEAIAQSEANEARLLIERLEDRTYAGSVQFDDADTGTYHSYQHDAPFVHYLEALLESLPVDGTEGMAVLPPHGQASIRRQREQIQAHLDWLMRHKYAYQVIAEANIEKTLGGLLIDRDTRMIASEVPDPDSLQPRFELLRIDPAAGHPQAGAWVYRDPAGGLHLQDGTAVEVPADALRNAPLDEARLTFRRANGDARLRSGLRFDWDGDGHVQQGLVDWVSWAGHCDIKGVMEALGIVLLDAPSVTEFRSDTGKTQIYDRNLLLEMFASVLELGSRYSRLDGTGREVRGIHHFGGSRNDSRPDRLQFAGPGAGRSFRWPLEGRQDAFRVDAITWADGTAADMGTLFYRYLPDLNAIDFGPNPRYLKVVEGDYNLVDVSGVRMSATTIVDEVDERTGFLRRSKKPTQIDLRPEATGRFFLGTHLDSASARRMFEVYWNADARQIEADLFVYARKDGRWQKTPLPGESVRMPMVTPLSVTLSREVKRDDPEQFQVLLRIAAREGKNICADTDKASAVWNGVVTRLDIARTALNEAARVERWKVDMKARFGKASLDFLLRRDAVGKPEAYCPAVPDDAGDEWADFLWHDVPDVGSKGLIGGSWVVNETMLEREIVTAKRDASVDGGYYVYDDHIKNVYELIFCGLAGFTHTIVHNNKRYAFTSAEQHRAAVVKLADLRARLAFRT